ncbi:MAG: sigma-70 family RNA polymerase sigma factor [Burkholderiaceae bacterium]
MTATATAVANTTAFVADAAPTAALPVSWTELATHRSYLVRFARRRLHDAASAEDAVHDVFEAVISGRAAFGGRAALRSWLTAVLKHKIVDRVRRDAQTLSLDAEDDRDETGPADRIACPQPQPDEVTEQRERLARVLAGIETLPRGLRDAIRLRVIEDRSTESVCRSLGISPENLFVRMHRARARLLC